MFSLCEDKNPKKETSAKRNTGMSFGAHSALINSLYFTSYHPSLHNLGHVPLNNNVVSSDIVGKKSLA